MTSVENRRKKQRKYVHIDWDKAATVFGKSTQVQSTKSITAMNILLALARAADKAIVFMARPHDMATVELLYFGTGPLSWESRRIIQRFAQKKYVSVQERQDGSITVRITKNGLVRALTYKLNTMALSKPKAWDRKWRVVIFDVPEKHRRLRDIFRMRLGQLGLMKLQESVYVSPYPCFDEVEFLRELYGIRFTVRYLLVENIEEDSELKRRFNLS